MVYLQSLFKGKKQNIYFNKCYASQSSELCIWLRFDQKSCFTLCKQGSGLNDDMVKQVRIFIVPTDANTVSHCSANTFPQQFVVAGLTGVL